MNSNEKRWIVLLVAVVIISIVFFVVMANINKRKDENSNTNNGTQQTADNTANEQYTTKLDDGTKILQKQKHITT